MKTSKGENFVEYIFQGTVSGRILESEGKSARLTIESPP